MTQVVIDVDINEVAQLFGGLNASLERLGIEPIGYTLVNTQHYDHIDVVGCDPDTAAANAEQQPMVNGYDLGDLQVEIDDQIGQIVEKIAHRYMPLPIARDERKRIVRQMADRAVNHSRQLET
jgi:hypothetical protein